MDGKRQRTVSWDHDDSDDSVERRMADIPRRKTAEKPPVPPPPPPPPIYVTGDEKSQLEFYKQKILPKMGIDCVERCHIPETVGTLDRFWFSEGQGEFQHFYSDDPDDMQGENLWLVPMRKERDESCRKLIYQQMIETRIKIIVSNSSPVPKQPLDRFAPPSRGSSWKLLQSMYSLTTIMPPAKKRWALVAYISSAITLEGVTLVENLIHNRGMGLGWETDKPWFDGPAVIIFVFRRHFFDQNTLQVYYLIVHRQLEQQAQYREDAKNKPEVAALVVSRAYLRRRTRELHAMVAAAPHLLPPSPIPPDCACRISMQMRKALTCAALYSF